MTRKLTLFVAAAGIIMGSFSPVGFTTHAEAGATKRCTFYAEDSGGRRIYGQAKRKTERAACKRAQAKCERDTSKARKQGRFGRNALPGPTCRKRFT